VHPSTLLIMQGTGVIELSEIAAHSEYRGVIGGDRDTQLKVADFRACFRNPASSSPDAAMDFLNFIATRAGAFRR